MSDPRVGVAVIVTDGSGRLLLQQRKGSHGAGTWSVPGGRVEGSEPVEVAAARELYEETNINVPATDVALLDKWTHVDMGDGGVWVTLYAAVVVPAAVAMEAYVREPDKCNALTWVGFNRPLPSPLFMPLAKLLASGVNVFTIGADAHGEHMRRKQ